MGDRKRTEYDVEISASATADELVFHEAPEVVSRPWGSRTRRGPPAATARGFPGPS
ncbi:hypothetical protein HFP72_24295 [Nocardiopsis sp. ARC36]